MEGEKVSGGALCALIVILIRNRDSYWSSQLSIAMFDSQQRVSVKEVTKEKRWISIGKVINRK